MRPYLFMFTPRGCGLGLRHQHYPTILENWPKVDWFEAISENYMDSGGRPIHTLEKIRARYPIALHGTALSIGSTDALSPIYLDRLKTLIERIDPFVVSDHLCWSSVDGQALHDLFPLPFTEEALTHVVRRVQKVQETIKRQILLENPSSYITFPNSEMSEWEFLTQVAQKSGCGILLDINNVYVNSKNHNFNQTDYLKGLPSELIGQIHLAGHTDMGTYLFDTHNAPVIDSVWKLYEEALSQYGQISTLIEWDEHIPEFGELMKEAEKAKGIYKKYEQKKSVIPAKAGIQNARLDPAFRRGDVSLKETEQFIKSKIFSEKTSIDLNINNPERISVYTNGYPARIRESLKEVFEAVFLVLGNEKFDSLAFGYAKKFPSEDYNLNFIGVHLPEFLKTHKYAESIPFLSDLAQLEWAIWKAFHAFDQVALKPGMLKTVSPEEWEKLMIHFQPSVALISSNYSVFDLWKNRINHGTEIHYTTPQSILVSRKDDQVRCELLHFNQYQLLNGLISGKTLGEVCEVLADSDQDIPIADWFSNWVQDGLIVSCQVMDQDFA